MTMAPGLSIRRSMINVPFVRASDYLRADVFDKLAIQIESHGRNLQMQNLKILPVFSVINNKIAKGVIEGIFRVPGNREEIDKLVEECNIKGGHLFNKKLISIH